MSLRDRCDDGEPETRSAAASVLLGAAEPLEGVREEPVRESGALVGDLQFERVALLPGRDADCTGSVTQCVVDQVADGLLDPEAVDARPNASAVGLDRPSLVSGATFEAHCDSGEELVQVDVVSSDRERSLV